VTDFLFMCQTDFEAYLFQYNSYTYDLLPLRFLPHKIHDNCHITIMAILELLPQPPGITCDPR
jgi:hypothetical protein